MLWDTSVDALFPFNNSHLLFLGPFFAHACYLFNIIAKQWMSVPVCIFQLLLQTLQLMLSANILLSVFSCFAHFPASGLGWFGGVVFPVLGEIQFVEGSEHLILHLSSLLEHHLQLRLQLYLPIALLPHLRQWFCHESFQFESGRWRWSQLYDLIVEDDAVVLAVLQLADRVGFLFFELNIVDVSFILLVLFFYHPFQQAVYLLCDHLVLQPVGQALVSALFAEFADVVPDQVLEDMLQFGVLHQYIDHVVNDLLDAHDLVRVVEGEMLSDAGIDASFDLLSLPPYLVFHLQFTL
jgi:hypothetical protein